MKRLIPILISILVFIGCGEDKPEKKTPQVVIDKSRLQADDEINATVYVCSLGDELVRDGNASKFDTTYDQTNLVWKMTLDTGKNKDLKVDECNLTSTYSRLCFQVNPEEPGTGMYQEISTETGKRYRVMAELIGADNVGHQEDFTQGRSYVSIEDSKPKKTSQPLKYSELVIGNIPKKVAFDFNATKETMYVQLRGNTAFAYPSAFYISVRELILHERANAPENTVECNL